MDSFSAGNLIFLQMYKAVNKFKLFMYVELQKYIEEIVKNSLTYYIHICLFYCKKI